MTQLFVPLALSATGAVISFIGLLLVAGIIGYLTAWFYAKSVYTPVIRSLRSENDELNRQVDGLNRQVDGLNRQIDGLNKQTGVLNGDIARLKTTIEEQKKLLRTLETDIEKERELMKTMKPIKEIR